MKTSGIDFELDYRWHPHFAPGSIQFRALATRVLDLTFATPAGEQDRLGQVSNVNRTPGVPKWAGNAQINYSSDTWQMGVQARYVGAGVFSTIYTEGAGAANTVNDNHVPAYVYVSLNAGYRFDLGGGRNVELFGIVNNLFDTAPPFIPSGAAGGTNETSTNAGFYDVVGRFFRVGARFHF